MIRYLADRLWQSLLVLAAMSIVIYGLIGLMPGDPIDLMISADPRLSSEDAARLKEVYGLDRPLLDRYVTWLGAALAGDLGYSRLQARPVLAALAPALGNTARLMTLSLMLSLAIALPAGIIAAYRRHSWIDHGVGVAAFVGISTPPFWTALVLIVIFAVSLGVLPAGGSGAGETSGLLGQARFLVLPVASLTLASVGGYLRYVRASMIETLSRDWIRTARAKGLSERRMILGHALRPALIPVATILGVDFGALFSGALVTETVFAYPGMGRLIYDAVLGNDYNLALAALLLATAFTLAGNLLADLAYVLLDRRITLGDTRHDG
jgi:peptide/nickel transport system permease protein